MEGGPQPPDPPTAFKSRHVPTASVVGGGGGVRNGQTEKKESGWAEALAPGPAQLVPRPPGTLPPRRQAAGAWGLVPSTTQLSVTPPASQAPVAGHSQTLGLSEP